MKSSSSGSSEVPGEFFKFVVGVLMLIAKEEVDGLVIRYLGEIHKDRVCLLFLFSP